MPNRNLIATSPFARAAILALLDAALIHMQPTTGRLDLRITLRFVDGAWQCDVVDGPEGVSLPEAR